MNSGGSNRSTVIGSLAPFEVEFRAELARVGYMPSSVRSSVGAMARLSRWLEGRGVSPSGLTAHVVADVRIAQLGVVLRLLREIGEVPGVGSLVEATPVEVLVVEFRAWLAGERGLSAATVRCYGKQARTFLVHLPEPLDVALQRLDAGQVTSFMLAYCRDRNAESAKATVTAVRVLLRFLHVAGHVHVSLAAAVPSVAGWRLASLPRGLDAAVVARCWAAAIGTRSWAAATSRS